MKFHGFRLANSSGINTLGSLENRMEYTLPTIITAPTTCHKVNVSLTNTTPATIEMTVVKFAKIEASDTDTYELP